jgi:hypothetical protein
LIAAEATALLYFLAAGLYYGEAMASGGAVPRWARVVDAFVCCRPGDYHHVHRHAPPSDETALTNRSPVVLHDCGFCCFPTSSSSSSSTLLYSSAATSYGLLTAAFYLAAVSALVTTALGTAVAGCSLHISAIIVFTPLWIGVGVIVVAACWAALDVDAILPLITGGSVVTRGYVYYELAVTVAAALTVFFQSLFVVDRPSTTDWNVNLVPTYVFLSALIVVAGLVAVWHRCCGENYGSSSIVPQSTVAIVGPTVPSPAKAATTTAAELLHQQTYRSMSPSASSSSSSSSRIRVVHNNFT